MTVSASKQGKYDKARISTWNLNSTTFHTNYDIRVWLRRNPIELTACCGPVLNSKSPHITYFASHAAPHAYHFYGVLFPSGPGWRWNWSENGEIVTSARLGCRNIGVVAGPFRFYTKNPQKWHFSYDYQWVHNAEDFLKLMIWRDFNLISMKLEFRIFYKSSFGAV